MNHIDKVKWVKYYCPACQNLVLRPKGKKLIKSWCEKNGMYTKLQRPEKLNG
jgi:hypothetical protein